MSYLIVVDRMPRGPQMFYPLDTDDVHEAMDACNAFDVAGSAVAMYDVDALKKKEGRAMKKDRAWKNVAFLPCPICDRPLTGRNVDLYDADGNEVNPNIDEIWIDRLVMRCRCGYRLNVPECKVDTMSKGWQQRFAEAANQRASPQSLVTASSAIECFLYYWGNIPGAPEHLEDALKSIDLACKAYDDLYSRGESA